LSREIGIFEILDMRIFGYSPVDAEESTCFCPVADGYVTGKVEWNSTKATNTPEYTLTYDEIEAINLDCL
jgi:hypothetical protein